MNRIVALLGTFFAAAAAPVAAQDIPELALSPGEAVTVRIDGGGRGLAPERGKAEWSDFDVYAARHLAGITPPEAPIPVATPFPSSSADPSPEPVPAGLVRVRLHSIAGKHTLLVVENGLDRALAYRARMTANGQSRPTDVCVVMPGQPSYEHWPHPIDRIELSAFRHVPWTHGQPPTCE